jgi:outer membrane receptor protein involved in Fe transport
MQHVSAQPFTDRLDEGRNVGRFVGGLYPALVQLDGTPWTLYSRIEGVIPSARFLGAEHVLRAGAELRREWNAGPGYQFDIEFPPQVSFNGVNGFDRPRRFDAIPPQATTAVYLDDRFTHTLAGGVGLEVQAGLRADVLHSGTWWASGARDAVLQPRINAQLSPASWLRLRAGWGRTSKLPRLSDLYPAPQYYDVINVNWYPPDSAERLAVLTTSIKNSTNPQLGYSVGEKAEAGVEIDFGRHGGSLPTIPRGHSCCANASRCATRSPAPVVRQPSSRRRAAWTPFPYSSTGRATCSGSRTAAWNGRSRCRNGPQFRRGSS